MNSQITGCLWTEFGNLWMELSMCHIRWDFPILFGDSRNLMLRTGNVCAQSQIWMGSEHKTWHKIFRASYMWFFFSVALRPNAGHGLLIHKVSRSHTTTHYSRYDSSGRVISSSQRPLPDNTPNTHNRQTSMPPVGFEPMISAGERPQTDALDRAATGTGNQ